MTKHSSMVQLPEVRVVEASAGSGKTYALAKRYVQLLLTPSLTNDQAALRHILAITFTNKAAIEMKARILEFLKSLALGIMPADEAEDLLRPTGLDPDSARRLAFAAMEDIIHRYNYFQVHTIDKFINAMLSGCAFKIGLTASFKIKTTSADYLEYSLDQLIDRARHEAGLHDLFVRFLDHYLYLEDRSGWFPKADMLSIIQALYGQFNTYGKPFEPSLITGEDLIKHKAILLEQIKTLRADLPEGTHGGFLGSLDKFLLKYTRGFDVDGLSEYFRRDVVPVNQGIEVSRDVEQLWDKIRSGITELCEEESVGLFNPYIAIFTEAHKAFHALSAKDDVLFLEELNRKAGALFDDDHVTVAELYYRLATRFRHYLIDEFQDTSRLQWHNLEKMTHEAVSTGGTMFYVGDRKQAIYGFRGGEVELFDEIKKDYADYNVIIDQLTQNWRSHKAIVEFNNAIFSEDNLRRFILDKEKYEIEKDKKKANRVVLSGGDMNTLCGVFGGAQQTHQPKNDQGCVRIVHIDADNRGAADEIIRERLLAQIRVLRERFAYRDIAILTRGNKEIELMTNWLLDEGILVESERTSNIKENPIVCELVAFLGFLHRPIDDLSFATFVMGDVFCAASGLSKEDMHQFIFSLRGRQKKEKGFHIYTAFRDQYPEVWTSTIEPFFKKVGLFPLYELMISLYHIFGCLERFTHYQGFLMHFLELIKKQEEEYPDIDSFLKWFAAVEGEACYVRLTDTDAVRMLTIHKSKGLEFPVVILPYLGMDVHVGAGRDNQQSYVMNMREDTAGLLRLKTTYYKYSDRLYQIYAHEYKKALLSELNNMYVALTRPQKELYVFIPKKVGQRANLARFLIPDNQLTSGTEQTYPATSRPETVLCRLGPSPCHNWVEFLHDEYIGVQDTANRQERLRGEVIHLVLSYITDLTTEDLEAALNHGLDEAGLRYPQVFDPEDIRKVVRTAVNRPEARPLFFVDGAEVRNEQDMINRYGDTKRMDRLVIRADDVTVIDFKTGAEPDEAHQIQVRGYMDLLKDIYPQHTIKGIIYYCDPGLIQSVA